MTMKAPTLFILLSGISLATLGEFLAPIYMYLIIAAALVLFDTVTGVAAAVLHRREELQSGKWRSVFNKIIQYGSAIVVSWMATYIFADISETDQTLKITQGVFGMIIAAEIISIYENITGSTGIDFSSFIKRFLPSKPEDNGSNGRL